MKGKRESGSPSLPFPGFSGGSAAVPVGEPLSFAELTAEPLSEITDPCFIKTSDNIHLAFYPYTPLEKPRRVLLFVHGGGACSSLGYQYLAETLSAGYRTAVYLLDLRGHGLSGGPRGDAPSWERVWRDLSEMIDLVKDGNPGIPLLLGGHSSGGGLVLNYAGWRNRRTADGYVFIAPKWGYASKADRYSVGRDPFARIRPGRIILNQLTGGILFDHSDAVEMNYSGDRKKAQPLLVDRYTCSMVKAVTPANPKKQFGKINRPFSIFIGAEDELFLPDRTVEMAQYAKKSLRNRSKTAVLPNQNHLGILRSAGMLIGTFFEGPESFA